MTGILAAMLAVSCASEKPVGSPPSAAPGAPRRIVSMTPSLTEILFALDLGDRVVGVTDFCDYPPEARSRPRVGGYANPSVEAILAQRPDLVLVGPASGNRDAALAARRAGVRLEVVPADSLEDTFSAIVSVARICGVETSGLALERALRERIAEASRRARGLPAVRALFCLQVDPIVAAGRETLPSELMELAGGVNVVAADRYPRLGIEAVIEAAPQVILQARMDTSDAGAPRRALDFWSRWPTIPAVRGGRVVVFDATAALRPGPRIVDAVEQLVDLLHGTGGEPPAGRPG